MKKTIILACALVFLAGGCSLIKSKQIVLTPEEAKAKVEEFINENLMQPDKKAVIKEVTEEKGLYKVMVDAGTGKDIESYVSLDGTKFFPQVMDMEPKEAEETASETAGEESGSDTTQAQQQVKKYSDGDIEKIKTFVDCLAGKDFKIYGADWCGWTKKLTVETFGGFDVVEPIYVECTTEKDLCAEEGISGYPTIKLNGEAYQGQRTFADFAKATGCEAPAVDVVAQANPNTGGCK